MGYKGAFWRGELRKCQVGMACRHTEQRMMTKTVRRKGKINVEGKATQRGVLADTTWSVEKLGVEHRLILPVETLNHVKDFQKRK